MNVANISAVETEIAHLFKMVTYRQEIPVRYSPFSRSPVYARCKLFKKAVHTGQVRVCTRGILRQTISGPFPPHSNRGIIPKLVIMTNSKELPMETINVAEAKSRFSELISRAAAGERFIIQRRERPVAALIGTTELERLERTSQAARRLALALGQAEAILDKIERREIHPAMAAYGLWRDEPDLTELAGEIAAERLKPPIRPNIDL